MNEYVSFRKWEVEGGREGGRLKKVLHPLITEEVVLCYTNIEIDSQVNFRSDVLVRYSITKVCLYVCPCAKLILRFTAR